MSENRIHGSFEMHFIESVVYIKAQGAWNLECVRQYIAHSEDIYAKTLLDKRHLIIDLCKLEGFTPEAVFAISQYNSTCRQRDMFLTQAFYANTTRLLIDMAMKLLTVVGSEQVALRDMQSFQTYIQQYLSEDGCKQLLSLMD